MASNKKRFIYLIALSIIILDQLTKYLVSVNISKPIPLLKNVLHLTYIKNTGAAFGILQNQTLFLIVISALVIGCLFYYCNKIPNSRKMQFFVALLLGGAIGNFIDRVRLGYVIDFIDFWIWPAFNIADSAVSVGAIGLVIYLLLKK